MTWLVLRIVVSSVAILLSACVAPSSTVRDDLALAAAFRKIELPLEVENLGDRPASANSRSPATPEQAKRNVLLGDWGVIFIDGEREPAGAYPIDVTIKERTIYAKSQCLPFNWEYSRSGEQIRIQWRRNIFVGSCHRGMLPWESRFSKAMLSATSVSTANDDVITISGNDGIVKLHRRWYVKLDVGYSLGTWQVVSIGGLPLAASEVIRLSMNPSSKIEAHSQCLRWLWSFIRGELNAVTVTEENPGLMCTRGLTRNEEAFEKIVDGASTIDQREDGTMLIRGAGGDILARRI